MTAVIHQIAVRADDINTQSGLVARGPGKADRRVTESMITEKGEAMAEVLDAARERLATIALADWGEQDLQDLTRLLRRFADNLMRGPGKP
jgi:DNA-binding MarR family transcriptional regulator